MTDKFAGYRTMVVAAMIIVFAILTEFGIVFPQSDQQAISDGVIALLMIVMRLVTKTPVGGVKPPSDPPA